MPLPPYASQSSKPQSAPPPKVFLRGHTVYQTCLTLPLLRVHRKVGETQEHPLLPRKGQSVLDKLLTGEYRAAGGNCSASAENHRSSCSWAENHRSGWPHLYPLQNSNIMSTLQLPSYYFGSYSKGMATCNLVSLHFYIQQPVESCQFRSELCACLTISS